MKTNKEIVQIFNEYFRIASLKAIYTPRIASLVCEYILNQNCWPALWVNDNTELTIEQKAAFVYHCINHQEYKGSQL